MAAIDQFGLLGAPTHASLSGSIGLILMSVGVFWPYAADNIRRAHNNSFKADAFGAVLTPRSCTRYNQKTAPLLTIRPCDLVGEVVFFGPPE